MKSCHALALALIGWYPMVPPFRGTTLENSNADLNAR